MDPLPIFLWGLFLNLTIVAKGQNLVIDPGFERPRGCPSSYTSRGQDVQFEKWNSPTKATPDCFNRCSPTFSGRTDDCVSVPRNFAGYQQPHSGNGYAGIVVEPRDYVEYLQTQLGSALKKDTVYRVEFWVSYADNSLAPCAGLGVHFSQRNMRTSGYTHSTLEVVPQVRMDTAITDSIGWVRVAGDFIAQGGERHLTIGFFSTGLDIPLINQGGPKHALKHAYYYVDDVQVKVVPPKEAMEIVDQEGTIKWTMSDVQFSTNAYQLLPEGELYLDSLCRAVLDRSQGTIHIVGHTDNTGTEAHNTELSQKRADAVAAYLAKIGIEGSRLVTKGSGSAVPRCDNGTTGGRSCNRRVEITIVP